MNKNIFVNTIPHSGTHLITSILDKLHFRHAKILARLYIKKPFLRRNIKAGINWRTSTEIGNYFRFLSNREVLVSVSSPRLAKSGVVIDTLSKMKDYEYLIGHMPFSEEGDKIVRNHVSKTITIVRDPRDMALSMLRHIAERPRHLNHFYLFNKLQTNSERFCALIYGFDNKFSRHVGLVQMYDSMLHWKKCDHNLTVKFEDIVGVKGGGKEDKQLNTLKKIVNHIELPNSFSDYEITNIGINAFGKTTTFRNGQIGKWRDTLSSIEKDVCKQQIQSHLVNLGYEKDNNW